MSVENRGMKNQIVRKIFVRIGTMVYGDDLFVEFIEFMGCILKFIENSTMM